MGVGIERCRPLYMEEHNIVIERKSEFKIL